MVGAFDAMRPRDTVIGGATRSVSKMAALMFIVAKRVCAVFNALAYGRSLDMRLVPKIFRHASGPSAHTTSSESICTGVELRMDWGRADFKYTRPREVTFVNKKRRWSSHQSKLTRAQRETGRLHAYERRLEELEDAEKRKEGEDA